MCGEIWALGFREPWRFSFDTLTHDLSLGDVGQDRFEEVGIVGAGENHGWNVIEGFNPFSTRYRREGATLVSPVLSYSHRVGVSVTGGYVYRGQRAKTVLAARVPIRWTKANVLMLRNDVEDDDGNSGTSLMLLTFDQKNHVTVTRAKK